MNTPSRGQRRVGRRSVLRAALTVPAAAFGASAVTSACSTGTDEPDELLAVAKAAKADAARARAVANAHPDVADNANEVAEARQAHARALRREIERVDPPAPDAPPTLPDAPAPNVADSPEQALADLTEALQQHRDTAGSLVPGLPPYRAGLAGSVSASCASLLEVLA